MLKFNGPKPISEQEAKGEIERVYHEIMQTMRVTGVNLNFRTWAFREKFLPLMWDAMRPIAGTLAFEQAGDSVRKRSISEANSLPVVSAFRSARLGESQAFQVRAALLLYSYINPKLLVFTAAVRLALMGRTASHALQPSEPIVLGAPDGMFAMEMVEEGQEGKRLKNIFDDITSTLSLATINSDYRTLALWPEYLDQAWHALKPITQTAEYTSATDRMRDLAREHAQHLPVPAGLTLGAVQDAGEDAGEILKTTSNFERIFRPLILNMATLIRECEIDEPRLASPFPAEVRMPLASGDL
ncbi:MAG: halocarboxylic acid dehydrogenase DehI family protein [Bryobacteraceae bacterium]